MRRVFAFAALIVSLAAASAEAADSSLPPPPLPTGDAARLMAREMALRVPHGLVNGQFVPSVARPPVVKSAAKADTSPCGQGGNTTTAAAPVIENGMRFFPIQRGASPRDFRLAGRGDTAAAPTPETPAKTNVTALAETAVQAAVPAVEVDDLQMSEDDLVTDPADPSAAAKRAVLDEIRRFRASRGLP